MSKTLVTLFVVLRRENPFFEVFPGALVPVTTILPRRANCGPEGMQDVFMLDLERCTEEQLELVGAIAAATFGSSREEALENMRKWGMPIRASQVAVQPGVSMRFIL